MKIQIYSAKNISKYNNLIKDLNLDIYYQGHFLEIEAEKVNGILEIFCVLDAENSYVFIYPYIKLKLNGKFSKYYDLTSPYGYCGPICNNKLFFIESELMFVNYMKNENVVSEFVRYHFVYNKSLKFSKNIDNEYNRKLVTFDLSKDWDLIWKNNISMNNRNYTNKFDKAGFKLNIYNDLDKLEDFIKLYEETMDNANANKDFYFKKEYYLDLFAKLNGKIYLANMVLDDKIYSSVLFFASGDFIQLYLSGRNLQFNKVPSFVPLYINIAKWAKLNKFKTLNLGGGRTNSEDDTLFKFKKRLSNDFMDFYIGKRIHNEKIYQELKSDYIINNGTDKYNEVKNQLQFYQSNNF